MIYANQACDDGIQNGNETGLDCGGPYCDLCPTGIYKFHTHTHTHTYRYLEDFHNLALKTYVPFLFQSTACKLDTDCPEKHYCDVWYPRKGFSGECKGKPFITLNLPTIYII